MPFLFDRLYGRSKRMYVVLYVFFDLVSSMTICLATAGLFSLYEPMTNEEFLRVILFAETAVLAGLGLTLWKASRIARPLTRWMLGERGQEGALEAWRSGVSLPRDFVVASGWQPFVVVSLPIAVYVTLEFELPLYSVAIIMAGCCVSVAYAAILHFFASELALRPVLQDVVRHLPPDFAKHGVRGVSLQWKLLGALPLINVITGVTVSGLSADARASLNDLGVDVIVAVLVAFTISLELTILVTKAVLSPVRDLLAATERVKKGDLSTRVPVVSGDEVGALAASFNDMVQGLSEREALREAFGSYVDPEVAERVMQEGALLEGEEVEVTVLFVDIRDFTAFADTASAREAVAHLNDFFGLVVPCLLDEGGHANKFIGDGLLGVFGAPDRHSDHADRAVRSAAKIAEKVQRTYGDQLQIGIGVNSGPVLAGSVGGGGRLEFTVIGDPVNVAARVEDATRETGDVVLVTEATRALLGDDLRDGLEARGAVPLKGKADPVPLYAYPVPGVRQLPPVDGAATRGAAVSQAPGAI